MKPADAIVIPEKRTRRMKPRTIFFGMRVTEEEKAAIEELAREEGLSESAAIRRLILREARQVMVNHLPKSVNGALYSVDQVGEM